MIIEYLRRIINPNSKIIINKNSDYNKPREGRITLKETDPSATLTEVNLIGFDPTQTYAFKLDVEKKEKKRRRRRRKKGEKKGEIIRISEYLNPQEPKITTACDGIIFSIIDGIFYVFFCEMKSKKPKLQDCIIKYKNSRLFINYIFSIIQEFYSVSSEFSFDEIEYKYILFDLKTNAQKTPTKKSKVSPESEVDEDDGKPIYVYKIHHLKETDLFNIRHLQL